MKIMEWIDQRIPLTKTYKKHIGEYPAPKNFNFWYYFGSLACFVLVNQLLTGFWLTMNYIPTAEAAFESVEYIMRDIEYGWLLRYMHSTGASAFFVVIYLHMFRGLIYGSYKEPRELLWIFGMFIFLALMAEAFMGYLLPWGQMSYWGAQVIISLFSAIPIIGEDLALWIRGDYVISGATLNRFFALHVAVIPLVICMLVFLHIVALHEVGSNNPEGIEIKKNKDENGWPVDGVQFHPYYTVKDVFGLGVFLIIFCYFIFFNPEGGGYFLEPPNYQKANLLKTPEHIAPVWYFTPFYSMLRAVPSKLGGVIIMIASIWILFVLPWIDRCKVKSIRYRSKTHFVNITVFAISFLTLGVLGTLPATSMNSLLSKIFTAMYFLFFIFLFLYSKKEATKNPPSRITK